ncbi:MAG TPA: VOC family protein [Pseudonocardia sp.]|nr:VOC family protein [Pseudonocardia sp.]
MPVRDEAWPEGTPCWVDAQLDDLDKGQEFYASLFGWTIESSPDPQYGGYRIASLNGRPVAGLGPKPGPMPSVWSTYIAVDDADSSAATITAAGGQLMMPVFDVGPMGRMTFATDVNGAAFGIWQQLQHRGVGVFNEPDTLTWNELHTRSFDSAKAFYGAVFGWEYDSVGDRTNLNYALVKRSGESDGIGGVNDDTLMAGEAMSEYWLVWFATADCDTTAAAVGELGGNVLMPPETTPFGRMSVVQGAQGEVFGLIDMATTAGEVPAAP